MNKLLTTIISLLVAMLMPLAANAQLYELKITTIGEGSVMWQSPVGFGNVDANSENTFSIGEGDEITFTFTPSSATYQLLSLTVNGADVTSSVSEGSYSISPVSSDVTMVATFGLPKEAYAVLSEENTVLTFYYDSQKDSRTGTKMAVTTGETRGWYDYMANITSVTFDASFADYTGLISTDSWFNECSNLTTINGIAYLNTNNVTNMSAMFRMCTSLTSIDFSNFSTSSATDLNNMFFGCSGLESLDLGHFDTQNVQDMHSMFAGCEKLTSLDLSNFNTASLTNIQGMFSGCDLLEIVNLSSFNTSLVTDVRYLFNACPQLTTVYVGSGWDMSSVTDNGYGVFNNCSSIVGGEGTTYSSSHIDYTYAHIDEGTSNPGYFTDIADYGKVDEAYAALSDENTVLTFYYDKKKDRRSGMGLGPFSAENERGWAEYKSNITHAVFDPSFANVTTITSTVNWFNGMENLTAIEGLQYLNTSNVTNMRYMFYRCSSLASLDLSSFDTQNVEDFNSMFEECSSLTTLDLSNFNTSNVTDMDYMFCNCSGLSSLNLSNFNTQKLTRTLYMFAGCTSLTTLDLTSFNTESVTDPREMFNHCSSLTTIYVGSGWSTSSVYLSTNMFGSCTSIVGGKGTTYDSENTGHSYAHIDYGLSNPGYLSSKNGYVETPVYSWSGNLMTIESATENATIYYTLDGTEPTSQSTAFTTAVEVTNDVTIKAVATKDNMGNSEITTLDYPYTAWMALLDAVTDAQNVLTLATGNENVSAEQRDALTSQISAAQTMYEARTAASSDITQFTTDLTTLTETVRHAAEAVDEPYAVLSDENTKLTFYYDKKKEERNGMSVGPFGNYTDRGWNDQSESITSVVFDSSFADYTTLTSTAYWFMGFNHLTVITDMGNLKTDNVADMSGMFWGCSTLTNIDVSNFNTSNVTNMGNMFYRCSELTSIDLSGFNTANVTNMGAIFEGCIALSSLNLTGFSTANVTNIHHMFWGCSNLTTINLNEFDTGNVTDMSYMFGNCSALSSLDLSTFNTSKVETMSSMFGGCSNLTTIYVGDNWTTESVTNSVDMFVDCTGLVGGAGTAYDTEHVDASYAHIDGGSANPGYFTDIADYGKEAYVVMADNKLTFYYDKMKDSRTGTITTITTGEYHAWTNSSSNVTEVIFDESFANYTGLTSTSQWFWSLQALTTITNLNYLNTANVTNMSQMFGSCTELSSLDLSNFNTSKATDISQLFIGCKKLTSLDLSNFNTSNVTNMNNLFRDCESLTSIDLSSFNTEKVTDMWGMFMNCDHIKVIDISSFNTSNVTNMNYMFAQNDDSHLLKTIYVGSGWSTAAVTEESGNMFSCCYNLWGGRGSSYDAYRTEDITYARIDGGLANPGYFTEIGIALPYTVLDGSIFTFYYDMQMDSRDGMIVGEYYNGTPWHSSSNAITSVVFDNSFANCTNITTTSYWFSEFSNLESITGLNLLNTDNVVNMQGMFYTCEKIKELNVGSFNTSKVNNMRSMFWGCKSLKVLDLSSFNTANVTNISYMFCQCDSLKTIYIGNTWTTESVTSGENTFLECYELVGGSGTTYSYGHIDNTYAHIDGGASNPGYFTDIADKDKVDEPYAVLSEENTKLTFYYDKHKEQNNGMSVGPFEAVTTKGWDSYASSITAVVFDNSFANDTTLTSTAHWFRGLSNLSTISGLENLKTSTVTTMAQMFDGCSVLTSIDLSTFITQNVTDMSYMFRDCSGLTSLDLSTFNVQKVTNMSEMFKDCSGLASLNLSGFNTQSVTDMSEMFYGCSALTSLNLSSFNTQSVTTMNYMFGLCYGLSNINFGSFNTTNVTNMSYMFYGCSALTSLDLSSFNTANVTDMRIMFSGCTALKTIYVSGNWTIEGLTESADMFSSCENLIGGMGTTYDIGNTGENYAHIDGGSANPGYLTDINATIWSVIGTINGDWDTDTRMESTDDVHFTAKFTGKDIGTYQFKVRGNESWDIQYPNNGDPSDGGTDPASVTVELENQSTITVMFNTETGAITSDVAGVYSVPGSFNGWDTSSAEMTKGSDGIYSLTIDNLTAGETYEYKIAVAHSWSVNYGADGQRDGLNMSFTVPDGETSVTVYFNAESKLATTVQPTGIAQAYALLSSDNTTLTFYYDDLKEWRQGMDVGPFAHYGNRPWQSVAESITTATFDDSFAQCDTLRSIAWWLYELTNLTQVTGMENLKTDHVTDMSHFLAVSWNLPSIDLSHLNTANVTNMEGMFASCWALTSLDLSRFNTEKVTNMAGMLNSLTGITTLDITSFNTANVTNMQGMFSSNPALTTIYVGDGWTVSSVTSGEGLFNGCTSLVGGMGTTYDADHIDADYAHLDGGTSNPGYFTMPLAMGDANGDGDINIADAVATVTNILGQPTEGNFYKYAADMNNDSEIDIFDVSMIVTAVFNIVSPAPARNGMTRSGGENITAEATRLTTDGNNLYLDVDQAERFTAFQFDMDLPEGTSLVDIKLEGMTDHQLLFVQRGDNQYRVVALSIDNEVFHPTNGHLVKILVSNTAGEGNVKMSNVLFVTPSATTVTGINEHLNANMALDGYFYDLKGRNMGKDKQQLGKGIYIMNHKKVIIK